MADGSVIIKVEMKTDGVQAGVRDIRAGCERAALAAEKAGRSMTRAISDGAKTMEGCGECAKQTGALVRASCGKVRDGLGAMTAENSRARKALEQMQAGLGAVRQGLATAFEPVVTAAAPLLIKLCELAAKAAGYVARFFAVLSGKNTYKKAAAAQDAITKSVAGTGKAAKDAAKNLAGLDELNIWQENKDSSGGGGGGPIGGVDVDVEDVPAEGESDFVVRLRDILFQWDDLNPELIAEKILTGLCAAAGGIIGYTLGGPVGGLIGLTLGALLGVKMSQVLFDGDGRLDKSEITKLVLTALGGLLGGVLGFVVGGPLGAAIGFTVGAGISVALSNAEIKEGVSVGDWVREKVVGLVQKAVDAYHAVVEFGAKVKNDARTWWADVKTWWGEKVGAVQAFTTSVTNGAAAWWANVKNWWGGTVGSVQSFTTNVTNSASAWWANVKNWWSGTVGSVQSFTTDVTNSASAWWSSVKTWWKGKVGSVASFKTSVTNSASTWWKNVKSWWSSKSKSGVTFKANVTSFADKIKNKTLNFKANITSFLGNAKEKVKSWLGLATGGIYKNGKWEPIAGYASGGNPRSARLFYANENGMPELVGRIGSSTAVMNNGQIVSSVAAGVYQAVAAAMGQVGGWFRSMSAQLANIPPAIEMLSAMPAQTPQPVLATGTVLPPKAVYASVEAAELTAAVRELHDMLTGSGGRGGETPIVVNVQLDGQVDGKALFRAVATEARIQRRASGKDPFAG